MDVIFSNEGTPLMAQGKQIIAFTSDIGKKVLEKTFNAFPYNNKDYVAWGNNNRQPEDDESLINKTTVLRTGLNYKCRVAHGQGVLPVMVEGYDERLNEIYKPVNDKQVISYLNDYSFESYLNTTLQNLFKFGNAFPIFTFNYDASKILRIAPVNSTYRKLLIGQ